MISRTYTTFGCRFYETGWVVFAGPFCMRWNRQHNYTQLAFERLKSEYRHYGGMTWMQWRQRRIDLRGAA